MKVYNNTESHLLLIISANYPSLLGITKTNLEKTIRCGTAWWKESGRGKKRWREKRWL